MFLDPSIGGSMKTKTDHQVRDLIKNMTENEHRADSQKKKRVVFGVNDNTAILANQTTMNKHLETLTKQVQAITMGQLQAQQAQVQQRCDFCQGDHASGESRRVKKLKERTMKLLRKCLKLKLGRWQSN